MRTLAMWLVDNVPIGKLAPFVFGFAIKRKGVKIKHTTKEDKDNV